MSVFTFAQCWYIYQDFYILYSHPINVTFYVNYMEGGGRDSVVGIATPFGLKAGDQTQVTGEHFQPLRDRP
jgi:hypothetical protein